MFFESLNIIVTLFPYLVQKALVSRRADGEISESCVEGTMCKTMFILGLPVSAWELVFFLSLFLPL